MGSTPRVVAGGPSIPGESRPQCQTLPRGLAPEVQRQSAPPPCELRFGWDQQKRFWKGSHPVDSKMELLGSVWLVSLPGKATPPDRPSRVSGLEAWLSSASPWICWPSACPCYGAPPVLTSLTGLRPQEDGWGCRGPTPPLPALVHFGPVAAGAEQCLLPHFPAGYRLGFNRAGLALVSAGRARRPRWWRGGFCGLIGAGVSCSCRPGRGFDKRGLTACVPCRDEGGLGGQEAVQCPRV